MNPPFFPNMGRELASMFSGMAMIYMTILAVATVVVHLLLMIGVYREASDRVHRGRKMWFVGPFAWAFLTMIGGIITAGIYWVVHHSTLSPVASDEDE